MAAVPQSGSRRRECCSARAPCTQDPYSTSDVLLEDSYFSTGDDGVAISKQTTATCTLYVTDRTLLLAESGWNCYGVETGVPSTNITIRNLTVISPTSAGACKLSLLPGDVGRNSTRPTTASPSAILKRRGWQIAGTEHQ
eukprot:SAG25_NODE_230_length_11432_cov_34.362481_4_plen_140_part_00